MGLNYYRFQEEEYALLNWLDGNVSLDEIKDRFEDEFPPQKITLDELQQFLGMLHRSGLVIAAVGGPGQAVAQAPPRTPPQGIPAAPWPTSSASASRASTPNGSSTGSIPR